MKIGAYVINLRRSIARWEGLSRKADSLALDVVRISGVDGSQIQPQDRADINKRPPAIWSPGPVQRSFCGP
jgi:glycosyl transferase family 25